MRKIYYQLAFAFVSTLLATIFLGCSQPVGRIKVTPVPTRRVVVGCEYYFDNRGVRGYYWMNGPPHKDLSIRACYDDHGLTVKEELT